MTNIKSTKRALLMSVVALFLCFTMLMGTTYAWFTDSVTSTGNKIVAGNLDVQLWMYDATSADYVDISDKTDPIFGADSLVAQNNVADTVWEPGKTQVVYLSIKNGGNLDLKYQVALDVKNVEVEGVEAKLTDVMQYAITPDAKPDNEFKVESWANGISVVEGVNVPANNVELKAGAEHFFALSVHMDEDAGNEYMKAQIAFDIKVLATQLNSEADSFNSDYDKLATYPNGAALLSAQNISSETVNEGDTVSFANEDETFKIENATAGASGTVIATLTPTNSTEAAFTASATNGKSLVSYDVTVTGHADGSTVTFSFFIGKNLEDVEIYHNGALMDPSEYEYNATTGCVTVTTDDFSPFEASFYYANVPLAKVTLLDTPMEVSSTIGMGGAASPFTLDVGYEFAMTQTAEEAAASKYAKYHADFVISVNEEVAPNAVALLGWYDLYCVDYNDNNWVALQSDEVIPADTEIRLIELLLNGGSINYEELGEFVKEFKCGASMLDESAVGTTLTVELRLYETKAMEDTANNTANEETGEYLTVCTYTYTFK